MRAGGKIKSFFSRTIHTRFIELHMGMLTLGMLLCVLGILMPAFLTEGDMGIYTTLRGALAEDNPTQLLYAAVLLLILNSLRSAPHYLGSVSYTHLDVYKRQAWV